MRNIVPQFLIDFSEKTNKKYNKLGIKESTMHSETHEEYKNNDDELIEQYDENDLLIEKESQGKDEIDSEKEINLKSKMSPLFQSKLRTSMQSSVKNILSTIPTPTPTPSPQGHTPTSTPIPVTHQPSSKFKEHLRKNVKENYNKQSEEEKIYRQKLRQYKTLFNNGKFHELEDLIDLNNKDSTSNEFKFNFTFDRIRYGDKQLTYIVRCIDNKNELGRSEEESIEDFDPKAAK